MIHCFADLDRYYRQCIQHPGKFVVAHVMVLIELRHFWMIILCSLSSFEVERPLCVSTKPGEIARCFATELINEHPHEPLSSPATDHVDKKIVQRPITTIVKAPTCTETDKTFKHTHPSSKNVRASSAWLSSFSFSCLHSEKVVWGPPVCDSSLCPQLFSLPIPTWTFTVFCHDKPTCLQLWPMSLVLAVKLAWLSLSGCRLRAPTLVVFTPTYPKFGFVHPVMTLIIWNGMKHIHWLKKSHILCL